MRLMSLLLSVAVLSLSAAVLHADPVPALHLSFDKGKIDGPVGKANDRGVAQEARPYLDLDRGTMAFFLQMTKEPQIAEWALLGGARAPSGAGYWSMLMSFQQRIGEFNFALHDCSLYAPPLKMPPYLGRWKEGQWVHLAVVWDRYEGISVYEDGRRVASNWGEHRWTWNLLPATLFTQGPVDEFYVFNEPLSDAQIAQLAAGQKPTGSALPLTPASDPQRRTHELARMGWQGDSLAALPAVKSGEGVGLTFTPIRGAVDAKRPVAFVHDGFSWSPWPGTKYGASIRGERLEVQLAPAPGTPGTPGGYDSVRVLVHRDFEGSLKRPTADGTGEALLGIQEREPTIWHRRLNAPLTESQLWLDRKYGHIGQIDLYRAQPLPADKPAGQALPLARAESLPENETGMTLLAETPARYRQFVLAGGAVEPSWRLEAPAFGGFQGATIPPQDSQAYDGVVLRLVAEDLREPTPVRIVIKEPVHGMRDWLIGDVVLQPKGSGEQVWTIGLQGRPVINLPPLRVPQRRGEPVDVPGVPVGFAVTAANAVTWVMGDGGSTIALLPTDVQQALPAATEDQVEFMREGYAEVMEGHLFRDSRIQVPLTWLAMFAPERMETRAMHDRVGAPPLFEGNKVQPITYTPPANDSGAPDWAFYQLLAMDRTREALHWIIDHKQVRNGEYGGVWNDDTIHIENWIGLALCTDDGGKIKQSLRKFWDGVWEHLTEGVGRYVQDNCHYYEEGMGATAMRMLVDYGDPIAVSRGMLSASHNDKWFEPASDGGYRWRSEYVSINEVWTVQHFGQDVRQGGHAWDLLVPTGYAIWYSGHPTAAQYYRGLPEAARFHGAAQARARDLAAARKNWAALATKPPPRANDFGPILDYIDEVGVNDAIRAAHGREYQSLKPIRSYTSYMDTEEHWLRYRTTGDVRYLADSYRRTLEWFEKYWWLMGPAQPSMDRNPLPRTTIVRARMGALAANRGSSGLAWPLHGLSYDKGGDRVAALVTENTETALTARFYAFTDAAHELNLRVWRLNPGTYRLTLAADANDDGVGGRQLQQREVKLDRGAPLELTLPPRQNLVMSLEAIKVHEPDYDRPDPAISAGSIELAYDHHLVVKVYNLGNKPVENLLVRVRDGRSGKVIMRGEQRIDRIDPPLDLRPSFRAIECKNIDANVYDTLIIEIDPDNEIDDFNRHNNRVVIRRP